MPKKSENMLVVAAVIPFRSELMFEKKSRLVPESNPELATKEVLLVDSLRESAEPCFEKESPLSKPFLATASFALFVRSPRVDFPTYVRSSKVFLLTPAAVLLASKAVLLASWTLLDASSAAFLASLVSWKKKLYSTKAQILICHLVKRSKDVTFFGL